MRAKPEPKAKPQTTTIRLAKETHRALAIRASIADMSMDEYLNWLMSQAPLPEETIRRAVADSNQKGRYR